MIGGNASEFLAELSMSEMSSTDAASGSNMEITVLSPTQVDGAGEIDWFGIIVRGRWPTAMTELSRSRVFSRLNEGGTSKVIW